MFNNPSTIQDENFEKKYPIFNTVVRRVFFSIFEKNIINEWRIGAYTDTRENGIRLHDMAIFHNTGSKLKLLT